MTRNHFQQSQAATHNTLGHFRTYSGLPRCPYAPARKLDFAIFKLFWYRFFPYHALMGWYDQEPLPAVPGSLTQHSGSIFNIFRVAAVPVRDKVTSEKLVSQAIQKCPHTSSSSKEVVRNRRQINTLLDYTNHFSILHLSVPSLRLCSKTDFKRSVSNWYK